MSNEDFRWAKQRNYVVDFDLTSNTYREESCLLIKDKLHCKLPSWWRTWFLLEDLYWLVLTYNKLLLQHRCYSQRKPSVMFLFYLQATATASWACLSVSTSSNMNWTLWEPKMRLMYQDTAMPSFIQENLSVSVCLCYSSPFTFNFS